MLIHLMLLITYYINSYNYIGLIFLPVREDGEFSEIIFGFSYIGLAVQPYVERFFLLDNYSNLLGISTLRTMGCRYP